LDVFGAESDAIIEEWCDMVMMVSKPAGSSSEHSLSPNFGLKMRKMGKFSSRFKLEVDKVWLNQYLTICWSGSGPELCTQCSAAVPHSRPVYNIDVGDCSYTRFRVTVFHLCNPADFSDRGSNGLNSPDYQCFLASLV